MSDMNSIGDLGVFRLLDQRLAMLGQRQKTVAENIANVNTPGFMPRDVDMAAFTKRQERLAGNKGLSSSAPGGAAMTQTDSRHLSGTTSAKPAVTTTKSPDSETTIDGNAVVVEEQVLRMNQIRTDFDAAMSLYQKTLSMVRMAARGPN